MATLQDSEVLSASGDEVHDPELPCVRFCTRPGHRATGWGSKAKISHNAQDLGVRVMTLRSAGENRSLLWVLEKQLASQEDLLEALTNPPLLHGRGVLRHSISRSGIYSRGKAPAAAVSLSPFTLQSFCTGAGRLPDLHSVRRHHHHVAHPGGLPDPG